MLMKRLGRTSVLVLAISVFTTAAAWAQMQQPPSQPGMPGQPDTPQTNPRTTPMDIPQQSQPMPTDPLAADKQFVKSAAENLSSNSELGKLAQEKGSSDAVKELGGRMAADQGKACEELKEAAANAKIPLSDETPKKLKKNREKLAKLSGADFDRAYAKLMVGEQKDSVKSFDREVKSGNAPQLKEFAGKTLPILQEHQKAAEELLAETNKSATAQSPSR